MKYLSENVKRKMSYALFCRLKPFYIRHPKPSDRETCLCKRHENLIFKVHKLKLFGLIDSTDLEEIAKGLVCNVMNKACMYRECEKCKTKQTLVTGPSNRPQ